MTQTFDLKNSLEIRTTLDRSVYRTFGTVDIHSAVPEWVTTYGSSSGSRVEEVMLSGTTSGSSGYRDRLSRPTSDRPEIIREMALLEAAARAENGILFVTILKLIRWESRQAEDYVQAIRLALAAGFHPAAWELVEAGFKRFPENAELNHIWQIFAPTKATSQSLPDRGAAVDMQWLKDHRDLYQGRWVALKSGELLGVGQNYQELIEQVGNPKGRGILITVVY